MVVVDVVVAFFAGVGGCFGGVHCFEGVGEGFYGVCAGLGMVWYETSV